MVRTFRMAYRPRSCAEVADRFFLTPLVRAITSPQDIYVLALAEKDVRLVRAFVNLPPARIHVPDLPKNAEEVTHRASIRERNQKGHLQGSEATKFLQYKFARRVDRVLSAALHGQSAPLVLAADEPLASNYRSINTFPGLVDETIAGNPNLLTDAQLEDAVLPILDRLYERELQAAIARFDALKPRRATTDVSYAAHAVTAGAVDQLLVDLDTVIPGLVSEIDGSVTYSSSDSAEVYSVVEARDVITSPTERLWSPYCAINLDEGSFNLLLSAWCVGCVHSNPDGRVDRVIPGAPGNHAARVRVASLPASVNRNARKVEVPRIGLSVDRLSVDLHQMHGGSAA
jgi:hypothetical protein